MIYKENIEKGDFIDMKIYDFSDCKFNNTDLDKKNTKIILSRKFDYNDNKESRVIVSNNKKRLVFLINSKMIVEQTGYSEKEKDSIINCLEGNKDKLLKLIK